ncbi:MAG: hypothetical protein ACR2IX_01745 [Limnohabitans sp.]
MNVNILAQVLRQRRYTTSANLRLRKNNDEKDDEKLIYKDVAGFIIFLVAAFSLLMVVVFG